MGEAAELCFSVINFDGVSRDRARISSPVRMNETNFPGLATESSPVMMVSSEILQAPTNLAEDFVGEQKKNDEHPQELLFYTHQVIELIM